MLHQKVLKKIFRPASISENTSFSKFRLFWILIVGIIGLQIYSTIILNLTLNFTNILNQQAHQINYTDTYFFISAVLIAPLLEELLFRGPLKLSDKSSGIYFVGITLFLFIGLSSTALSWNILNMAGSIGIMAVILIMFVYSVIAMFANISKFFEKLRLKLTLFFQNTLKPVHFLINKYPDAAIWYSSLSFLIMHSFYANNQTLTTSVAGLFSVIITGLPLVIFLVYLRLRYGLIYAILCHSLFNLTSILIVVFFVI